jgi:hypothetical protein
MNEERMTEVLAAHADGLTGSPAAIQQVHMTNEEHSRLAPLFELAERLQHSMPPVQPSAAFVQNLGKDLIDKARRQIALTKRVRRITLIGAAALGSLLSIASVVGAIAFVVARLRARAQTRTLRAPAGQA